MGIVIVADRCLHRDGLLGDLHDLENFVLGHDIIESTFGIYKSKKSPNKLYGICLLYTSKELSLRNKTMVDFYISVIKRYRKELLKLSTLIVADDAQDVIFRHKM